MRRWIAVLTVAISILAFAGAANSATYTYDLTPVISDSDIYTTGGGFKEFAYAYNFPAFLSLTNVDTLNINVIFSGGKYLELQDVTTPEGLIDERVSTLLGVYDTTAKADINIDFTGVSGNLFINPIVQSQITVHSFHSNDLTDTSFLFHDIHISYTGFDSNITPTYILLDFQADSMRVGTDAALVPEPSTMLLLGCGLVGLLGYGRMRLKTGR